MRDTVTATVLQLKAAGMLQPATAKTAVQKTEELLRQYPQLRNSSEPYALRVVAEIDALLAAAENEPYVDVIRLYYFGGLTNEGCANTLCCDERTCRRYRKKLVQQFSVRLASDEFIRELLE
ncbi:MAG: hypothetical protein IKY92_03705 [Akkermansia sp.]|nr:hypothetical protein [Akkermansia sp.]